MPSDARAKLVRQLKGAYSGELAAGYAYRGHWRSVREGPDRTRIREIEADEWHHRDLVGGMLRQLGVEPSRIREAYSWDFIADEYEKMFLAVAAAKPGDRLP